MKRLFYFLILILGGILSACAHLGGPKRELVANQSESSATQNPPEMVAKSQYDQLLSKYEALLKLSKESEQTNAKVDLGEQEVVPTPVDAGNGQVQAVELVSAINDTVEVDKVVPSSPPSTPSPLSAPDVSQETPDIKSMEKQIQSLQNASLAVEQNQYGRAIGQLKQLEKSSSQQIVVRSKYLLGEILFKQQEYDLAMQIFEEIINKYAFSGLVLQTLGRLVVCSEKLKLTKKRELYYSILHDFFESNT